MANETLKVEGVIKKVVRADGKADAQLHITIPVGKSANIPLGSVVMTIMQLQNELFDSKKPVRGAPSPKDI